MKRVLILLVLCCYILCAETPCFSIMDFAKDEKECASRKREDKGKNCCYLEFTAKFNNFNVKLGECYEMIKGVDEATVKEIFENQIKPNLNGYLDVTFQSYKCSSSSFLKIGFLLLSLILL